MNIAVINWQGNPLLLELGNFRIAWYGVLFALAFFLGNKLMVYIFKRENIPTYFLDKFFLYMFIGIIVGARLGHCIFYDWHYFSQHPFEIIKIWKGGLASHGGIIGILLGTYLFTKKYSEIKFWWLLDRLGLALILGAPLIRFGNFLNSEIVGEPTQLPWGVKFLNHLETRPDLLINGEVVARHPAQIYEAICYIFIFVICYFIYRLCKNLPNGLLSSILFCLVFLARFFVEFIKVRQADYAHNSFLSVGQYLSLPLIILGFIFTIFLSRKLILTKSKSAT